MDFFRIVWGMLGSHRRAFVWLGVGSVAYESLKAGGPYLVGAAIDAIAAPNGVNIVRALWCIAGVVGLDLVTMALDVQFDRHVLQFLYGVERDTHVAAGDHALARSLAFHEREQAGRLLTRITRGATKLLELLMDTTWQGMPTIIQILVTFVAMAIVNVDVALAYAAFLPIFLAVAIRQQQVEHPFRRERHERYEDASAHLDESIWNVLTVQSFGRERASGERYRSIFATIIALGRSQYLLGTRYNFVKGAVLNSGRWTILLFAAWKAWRGEASVGDVVLLFTLSEKAFISCFNLSRILERIADAREAVTKLAAFLAEPPELTDPARPVPAALRGGIAFNDVSFSYGGNGTDAVLRNVSFGVRSGETIAFAGPSGGGKSTIVKLLFRHYDPTEGRVLLECDSIPERSERGGDGKKGSARPSTTSEQASSAKGGGLAGEPGGAPALYDVRTLARAEFRQQLGYVPQEGQLFSGTVAENVRFGKSDATDAEVRAAVELAGAAEFVTHLPSGYDTMIGEQGVRLSGGQRQRICIARAVVRKPKILVFDEATSALDVESERIIQEALERLRGTTTIIVISHRLSTIRHANRILIVEDGRIIEEGSHGQLLRQNGLYQRLVRLQDTAHARTGIV